MRHIHRLLQQCLDQAIREGLIAENPARAFPLSTAQKVSANVLTPAEGGGLSGRSSAAGLPPHVPAGTDGGASARRVDRAEMERPGCKRADADHLRRNRAVERRELVEYEGGTRTVSLTQEGCRASRTEHARHPSSPLMFMHPATQKPYSPQMVRRMHNEIIKGSRSGPHPLRGPPAHLRCPRPAKWDGHQRGIADAGPLPHFHDAAELRSLSDLSSRQRRKQSQQSISGGAAASGRYSGQPPEILIAIVRKIVVYVWVAKEMMTMENKLLKELYDHFYTRPELDEQENRSGGVPQKH